MLLPDGGDERFARDTQVVHARRREARRMDHEARVDVAAPERRYLHVTGRLDELELHLRPLRAEGAHPARQQAEADRGHERELQPPALAVCRRAGVRRQRCGAREQVACFGHERGAGGRQFHAALGAVEQPHAQAPFQQRDGLRERRLRDVQALRRAAEVQLLGDGDELAPQAQVDGGFTHMPSILIHAAKWIGSNQACGAYLPPWTPNRSRCPCVPTTSRRARRARPTVPCTTGWATRKPTSASPWSGSPTATAPSRLATAGCRSSPTLRCRASSKQEATRRSSARRRSPTGWRWAPRA